MATEKRLIDANALKAIFDKRYDTAFMQERTKANATWWDGYATGINWGRNTITDVQTVDAVEVIRCKDCKWYDRDEFIMPQSGSCEFHEMVKMDWDFCSLAKMDGDGDDV